MDWIKPLVLRLAGAVFTVLAYIAWHRPAREVDTSSYEQSIAPLSRLAGPQPAERLRRFGGFRAAELPWSAAGASTQPFRRL